MRIQEKAIGFNRFADGRVILLTAALAISPLFLVAPSLASNLVVNPDFSAGNTGFSSSYAYGGSNLYPANTYSVTTPTAPKPSEYNGNWTNPTPIVPPGSPGGAQMMMVNGGESGTNTVWSESGTAVMANTNYNFSVWVDNLYPASPATLNFSIDGVALGSTITVNNLGTWKQYYSTWYSGSNTSANLGLIDTNTAAFGNDFAFTDLCLSSNACNSGTPVGGTTGVGGVPLPPTFALLAAGLAAFGVMGTLKRRRSEAG